jgi:hypothetical protein
VGATGCSIQCRSHEELPERDVDSLKRTLKCLYTKPKPTGQDEVSVHLRPVVWAQAIQQTIKAACGVQTSHDVQDDGEDDEAFMHGVNAVLGPPPRRQRAPGAGSGNGSAEDTGAVTPQL